MARVFISYGRQDVAAAKAFATALTDAGHEVWWDSQISAGSRFSREIDAALGNAAAVVVLWSRTSIESAWVQDEASEGLERHRLVPALIERCKPPLGFRQYQTIDMQSWRRGGAVFDPLLAAIAAKAGEEARPASASEVQREDSRPGLSVCVLPFTNMSGDLEQEYFADGIAQDVITDLAKVAALEVIARPDSAAAAAHVDVGQLARDLGVSHVLEGSVRKAGSRLRITAQLLEAGSARHVWAERYDRDISDIFTIQDEIAKAIVAALQLKLLPNEKKAIAQRSTSDPVAYDSYLKARQSWTTGNFGDWRHCEEIVRLCAAATAVDPAYALAWALMAMAQSELHFWHGKSTAASASAERAIALNPALPEPYCVRARYLEEEGKDEEARAEIEKALRLDGASWEANREAARMMFRRGELQTAIPFLEKATAVAAKDHDSASMLISCHAFTGDEGRMRHAAEMAVSRAEKVIIADPTNGAAFASAARGLAALGETDRAKRWIRKALNVDPGNLAMRYSVASTMASLLHDGDAALEVLEPFAEAAAIRPHLRLLESDPAWASVRDHPRFRQMTDRASRRVGAFEPAALSSR